MTNTMTGIGSAGLREEALLVSAVAAPQATLAGERLLTDPVALATCLVFLEANKLLPEAKLDAEAWEMLTLDVAASRIDREERAKRLRTLLRPRKWQKQEQEQEQAHA